MFERRITGKGKRARDQTTRGGSSISPPKKRTMKAAKRNLQPTISEWLTDDEIVCSQVSPTDKHEEKPPTPSPTIQHTPTSTQHSMADMLSPIMSQPGGSAERSPSQRTDTSPITNTLNLAASATSLRNDFATCERILTEKHQFVVSMLDTMHNKVIDITNKLCMLDDRVKKLEETDQIHTENARGIYQTANKRQNDLEKKINENLQIISGMEEKCKKFDELSTRITQVEQYLAQQYNTGQSHPGTVNQTFDIAIYGLDENNDVTGCVNTIFTTMNLGHVRCVSAHRTPRRPEMNRPGVVVAQLSSLEDKQAVLERKRHLRNVPQYYNVFIKSSMSHPEQVMHANFAVVLNEMTNGDSYYISDNGRIHRKSINRSGDHRGSGASYGGARPKVNTHSRDSRYNGNATRYERNNTIHYTAGDM